MADTDPPPPENDPPTPPENDPPTPPTPPTPPPAPPEGDADKDDLREVVKGLTETVSGLVASVQSLVANNGLPDDKTPIKVPWTHRGGSRR